MKSFSDLRFDIVEVLTKDSPAGKWIHDFVKSDAPQFAGKSEKKRKQMALAAYYAKQNESKEAEVEEPEEVEKKEDSVLPKAKKKKAEEKDCSCDEEVELDESGGPLGYLSPEARAREVARRKKAIKANETPASKKFVDKALKAPVKEAVQTPEQELERLKLRQDAEHGKAPLKRQAETQARIRELQKQVKEGLKPEHNLRPGWMLKKDPELAKKIEAKTKAYKALAKYAGKKIEKKD